MTGDEQQEQDAYAHLRDALHARGPTPCQTGDPETWFPGAPMDVNTATELCAACAVQAECLAYAIAADVRFGIWGGQTPAQRSTTASRRP